ncbi:MAG TPA: hypothetical protein VE954_15050 [Oligoflexus sp.]|uniref:hypothetical protein n=1 Tax=Oligoflexus sp. TaxID=1971216 RepID=UPI002D2C9F8E|nr:hypothetical protein [Oligoflexus sp.]HYX34420.1 hypothetical protein [Oligoflexus sp.]
MNQPDKKQSHSLDRQRFENWIVLTARDWRDLTPIMPSTGITVLDWDRRSLLRCAFDCRNYIVAAKQQSTFDISPQILRAKFERLASYFEAYLGREQVIHQNLGLKTDVDLEHKKHIYQDLVKLHGELTKGHFVDEMELHAKIMHPFLAHFKQMNQDKMLQQALEYASTVGTLTSLTLLQPITGCALIDRNTLQITETLLNLITGVENGKGEQEAMARLQTLFQKEMAFASILNQEKMAPHVEAHQKLLSQAEQMVQNAYAEGRTGFLARKRQLIRDWLQHQLDFDNRDYAFYKILEVALANFKRDDALRWILNHMFHEVERPLSAEIFAHIFGFQTIKPGQDACDHVWLQNAMQSLYDKLRHYDRDECSKMISMWGTPYIPQSIEDAHFLQMILDYEDYAKSHILIHDELFKQRLLKAWIMNSNIIGSLPHPTAVRKGAA